MASLARYNVWQPSVLLDSHEELVLFSVYGSLRPRIAAMGRDALSPDGKDWLEWDADFLARTVLAGDPVWRADIERLNRLLTSVGQPNLVFAQTPRTDWMRERGAMPALRRGKIVKVSAVPSGFTSPVFLEDLTRAFLRIKTELSVHPSLVDAESAATANMRGVATRSRDRPPASNTVSALPAETDERTMMSP